MKCDWERLYVMQLKKATKKDDGLREVLYNKSTGEYRIRKKTKEYRLDERANSPLIAVFTDEKPNK